MAIFNLTKFGSFVMDDKKPSRMAGMALPQSVRLSSTDSNAS